MPIENLARNEFKFREKFTRRKNAHFIKIWTKEEKLELFVFLGITDTFGLMLYLDLTLFLRFDLSPQL